MPKYQNHLSDYRKIEKALKEYCEGGSKSQQQCCDENDVRLSVFRYYYHHKGAKLLQLLELQKKEIAHVEPQPAERKPKTRKYVRHDDGKTLNIDSLIGEHKSFSNQ